MKHATLVLLLPLAIAACTSGERTTATAGRDLSLVTADSAPAPAVLSDIERGSMKPQVAPARRQVKRSTAGTPAAVATPAPEMAEVQIEPVTVASTPQAPEREAEAAPQTQPSAGGIGTPLAAGETVTIVPAVSMGGGVRGGRGDIDMPQRGGSGAAIGFGHGDNCAPTRGTVIAVNRPYASLRRF